MVCDANDSSRSSARSRGTAASVPFRRAWEELLTAASTWPDTEEERPQWRPGGIGYLVPSHQEAPRRLRRIRTNGTAAATQVAEQPRSTQSSTMRTLLERFYGLPDRSSTTSGADIEESSAGFESNLTRLARRRRREEAQQEDQATFPDQSRRRSFQLTQRTSTSESAFVPRTVELQDNISTEQQRPRLLFTSQQQSQRLIEPRERLERLRALNLAAVFDSTPRNDEMMLDETEQPPPRRRSGELESWMHPLLNRQPQADPASHRYVRLVINGSQAASTSESSETVAVQVNNGLDRPFC